MANNSQSLLDSVRQSLRINHSEYDEEITDLIAAVKADLLLSGILAERVDNVQDSLIKRAIITYVKSQFGLDNKDMEKYQESYNILKIHLMLSSEYIKKE